MIDVSRQHSRREGTPFGGRQTHQSSEKRMDFGRLRRCKILDIFGNDASRIGPKLAVSLHFWAYFGSALCTLLWCNEQFGSSNSCNLELKLSGRFRIRVAPRIGVVGSARWSSLHCCRSRRLHFTLHSFPSIHFTLDSLTSIHFTLDSLASFHFTLDSSTSLHFTLDSLASCHFSFRDLASVNFTLSSLVSLVNGLCDTLLESSS